MSLRERLAQTGDDANPAGTRPNAAKDEINEICISGS